MIEHNKKTTNTQQLGTKETRLKDLWASYPSPAEANVALLSLAQQKRAQNLTQANQIVDFLLKQSPNFTNAKILKGQLYLQNKQAKKALVLWSELRKAHPQSIHIQMGLGNTFFQMEKYAKAENIFKQVVQQHPKKKQGYRGLARLANLSSNKLKELHIWDEILKLFPTDVFAKAKKAVCLMHLHRIDELEVLLEELQEVQEAKIVKVVFRVYYGLGRYISALKFAEKILTQNINSFLGLSQKLLCFAQLDICQVEQKQIQQQLSQQKSIDFFTLRNLAKWGQFNVEHERDVQEYIKQNSAKFSTERINRLQAFSHFLGKKKELTYKKCPQQKIDIVYTWVNKNDAKWQKRYQRYIDTAKPDDNNPQTASFRYTDNGEILFSLKTIERYFKTVNNIYIVTDEQRFDVSNLSDFLQQKIKFIDHHQIIPKEYLPIYNSFMIEAFLWKIPALQDCFLYFNDDTFLGASLSIKDLFASNGTPYAFLSPGYTNTFNKLKTKFAYDNTPSIEAAIANAHDYFYQTYRQSPNLVPAFHQVFVMHKKACEIGFNLYVADWKKDFFKQRKRSNYDVQTIVLYNWIGIHLGYQSLCDYHSLHNKSLTYFFGINEEGFALFFQKNPQFFCINGMPNEESKQWFKRLENKLLL